MRSVSIRRTKLLLRFVQILEYRFLILNVRELSRTGFESVEYLIRCVHDALSWTQVNVPTKAILLDYSHFAYAVRIGRLRSTSDQIFCYGTLRLSGWDGLSRQLRSARP